MLTAELSQVTWRKSSRSGNGQDCVEVGVWRKSSLSGNGQNCVEVSAWGKSSLSRNGSNCVEVASANSDQAAPERLVLVRDSKDPDGPVLAFTPSEWDTFIASIKDGSLGDLA